MHHTQADLDLAERHVEDGRQRVAEQRERIAKLRELGKPTAQSEELLRTMLDLLEQMRRHRDDIARDVKPDHFSN